MVIYTCMHAFSGFHRVATIGFMWLILVVTIYNERSKLTALSGANVAKKDAVL